MSVWRRIGRIVLWVVGVVLAIVVVLGAFLAISIALDGRGSAARLDSVTNTTIPGDGGPDVRAYVAKPSTPGPHPVVVMIHEFWGLNPDIVSKADLLAEEGYLVVAPDVFRGSTTGYVPKAIYQVISTPADEVNQDLDAVIKWTASQPEADSDAHRYRRLLLWGTNLAALQPPQPDPAGHGGLLRRAGDRPDTPREARRARARHLWRS